MGVIGLPQVCHEKDPFDEVNHTNHFKALKLGGPIEWESTDFKISHNLNPTVLREIYLS